MRITNFMLYNKLNLHMQNSMEEIAFYNERLATQKNFSKPSDDVTGVTKTLGYKVSINENDQFKRNIEEAKNTLQFSDTVLSIISDNIDKVKDAAVKSSNGGLPTEDITLLTGETEGLRNEILDLTNSKLRNKYIFSGFKTDTQTYSAGYVFQGDTGAMNIIIGNNETLSINTVGLTTFGYIQGASETATLPSGSTVSYAQGAGTTQVDVTINKAGGGTDTFSFSNIMEATDIIKNAIAVEDTDRINAMLKPLEKIQTQITNAQSSIGSRLNRLQDQVDILTKSSTNLSNIVSSIEDADLVTTLTQLRKSEATLQSLRSSSAKILSQSLLDFI